MTIGNMHKKIGKDWPCSFRVLRVDRQKKPVTKGQNSGSKDTVL